VNVILIVTDTFRKDHLGCYGADWMHTPHLDRFAERSVRFKNYYPANFPTVPNRYDLMTGRFTFHDTQWEPLRDDEVVLPEILGANGYISMHIADAPHCLSPGMNFQRGFTGWDLIRGQESDPCWTTDETGELPCDLSKIREGKRIISHILQNTATWRSESDTFVAQTMRRSATWLEKNRNQDNFFLYIDTFDPHEPWMAPQYYVDMYDPGYTGQKVIYPRYRKADYLTRREMKHMRAQYAAECTLVDRWIGHLMATVESLKLFEDTVVMITSDHGFLLGEHDLVGKLLFDSDDPTKRRTYHFYEELIATPLLISAPGALQGKHSLAMCSTPDIMATVLDYAGVEPPAKVQGKSLRPVLEGKSNRHRSFTCSACSFAPREVGLPGALATAMLYDGRYTYMYGGTEQPHELYDFLNDPKQKKNLIRKDRERARKMHRKFLRWCEEIGTAEEYIEERRNPGF
jgi:arylsulfatase A-like enzyme